MVDLQSAQLNAVFAAVADPTRRRFLSRLTRSEATISELAAPLTMTLEAASKHVRVLERAGLVRRHRAGRSHVVRLNAAPLAAASDWLNHYRAFWTDKLAALAAYVESEPDTESATAAPTAPASTPSPVARKRAQPLKGPRNAGSPKRRR